MEFNALLVVLEVPYDTNLMFPGDPRISVMYVSYMFLTLCILNEKGTTFQASIFCVYEAEILSILVVIATQGYLQKLIIFSILIEESYFNFDSWIV